MNDHEDFGLDICNTMAGSGRDAAKGASIVRRTLRAFPTSVVTGVVEASNLLGTSDWKPEGDKRSLHKIQAQRVDKAGVAAIVDLSRVEVLKIRYRLGAVPFISGRRIKMRKRWILVLTVRIDGRKRRRTIKVAHLPPKRYWVLWAAMIVRLGRAGADLADFNKLAPAVAKATGKKPYMDKIIGQALPRTWRAWGPVVRDVGGDHNAVHVDISHHQKR